jgi:TolB-like protein
MPSITRREFVGAGLVGAAGVYGASRLHRGATDATFDAWTPDPGTWPLPRYDSANTAFNPNAGPPREGPTASRIASAATAARRPRLSPLVGADHLVVYGSGFAAFPRGGRDAVRERDAPTPLAGFGPDGRLHAVVRDDADAPATLVGYGAADLRETTRFGLDADHPQGLIVGSRETYVGGQDGTLRALDPDSGRRWRVDGAMPALDDGRLYAADAPLDGTVAYAERTGLDRRLGVGPARAWSAGTTDGFPDRPAVANGRVVLGTHAEGGGVLAAVDADSGERLWTQPFGRDVSTPAVVGDRGYVAVGGDATGFVAAVDLSSGETVWRDDVDWRASTPAVGGETLVVAGERRENGERAGGVVRAYDTASGDVLWTQAFDAPPTGVALVEDRVVVTAGSELYALG